MNKKILFSIMLATVLIAPFGVNALECGSESGGNELLTTVLDGVKNAASAVGTALAVIGFIIAGIMYLTAAGSPERMGGAKKALIAAVIGTAILAIAQGADIMTGIFCAIIGAS